MTAVDLTGADARWTAGRDALIVVRIGADIVGRECRDCRAVKPASALAKKIAPAGVKRATRHVCRACAAARRRGATAEGA